MKTKYINLSFEKPLKASRELSKIALKRYKSVDLKNVNVKERYSFFIPEMNSGKDFFFLQSYKGFLDLTDRFYLVHYGLKSLKDFKICLHESFYNKIVEVVIFEHENKTLYGILFKNTIYYEPDTVLYSDKFFDVINLFSLFKTDKYYRLNRLKDGEIRIDKLKHEIKSLSIDLRNMYYLWSFYIGSNQEQILIINKYNKKFLKEFYVDKFIVVSKIKKQSI